MASQHVFVIGHERSGTRLSIDALRNNFEHLAAPYLNVDRLTSFHRNPADPKRIVARLREAPRVIKSHMHSEVERYFEDRHEAISLIQSLGRGRQRYDRPLRSDLRRVVRTSTIRGRSRLTARAAEKLYKLYMKAFRGTDLTSTDFRRGGRGDYRQVFSEEDLAFFDERAGRIMRRLGYYEETQRAAQGRTS